jgi:ADP-ribosylglycohydrolase
MIGAIIGDISGSTYEFSGNKNIAVPLLPADSNYTDDTIMTVGTATAILSHGDYKRAYLEMGRRYPDPMGGYGIRFSSWLRQPDPPPYDSWGNGSAMRVSPVGWAYPTVEDVLAEAERSAAVSHNHPEGIKGAQATAAAVWLARSGSSKEEIRAFIERRFGYNLSRTANQVRSFYVFNESCEKTVPEALIAFLDSTDFESAIRLAISLGGDADTVGCITGAVAEAFYRQIPDKMVKAVVNLLPINLLSVVSEFEGRYGPKRATG